MNTRKIPEGLLNKILIRIKREEAFLALRKRIMIFSAGAIGSFAAFIPAFKLMQSEFSQSGFIQIFSLIFSDTGIVLNVWATFALSILESLPVLSIAAFLAAVFVFLISLKFLAKDISAIFAPLKLANA